MKRALPRLTSIRLPAKPENAAAQRALDAQAQTINSVLDTEIIRGRLIEDVELVSGETTIVQHGLGREPRGYIIVWKSAAVTGDYPITSSRPRTEISLTASSTATVSLWIF
jgi:hypothetical protein